MSTDQEREALVPWKVRQKELRAARREHFSKHLPGTQSPGDDFAAGYRAALAANIRLDQVVLDREEWEQNNRAHSFALFVAALDKPIAASVRRTITLERLIEKAKEALIGSSAAACEDTERPDEDEIWRVQQLLVKDLRPSRQRDAREIAMAVLGVRAASSREARDLRLVIREAALAAREEPQSTIERITAERDDQRERALEAGREVDELEDRLSNALAVREDTERTVLDVWVCTTCGEIQPRRGVDAHCAGSATEGLAHVDAPMWATTATIAAREAEQALVIVALRTTDRHIQRRLETDA
jgi:rubrerythrin